MKLLTRKGRVFGYNIYLGKWRGFTGWWGNVIQFKAFGFIVISRIVISISKTALVVKEVRDNGEMP